MSSKNKITDFLSLPENLEGNYSKHEELSIGLYMALGMAYQTFSRELAKKIKESNLTQPQFGVLETLLHYGPTTLSSLGDKLLVTAGNITCVVDKLETMGLVKRERDYSDRRIIVAELTQNGREMINSIYPSYIEKISELTSELSEKEKHRLQELLKKLSKTIPYII